MCCTAEKGCGIVKPDFVQIGEYTKDITLQWVSAREFLVKGLQSNYYYESNDEARRPMRFNQVPLSDMQFVNYSTTLTNESVFDLPTNMGNCEQSCGWSSVCALVKLR